VCRFAVLRGTRVKLIRVDLAFGGGLVRRSGGPLFRGHSRDNPEMAPASRWSMRGQGFFPIVPLRSGTWPRMRNAAGAYWTCDAKAEAALATIALNLEDRYESMVRDQKCRPSTHQQWPLWPGWS
jgi:hypothetical protein